MISRGQAAVAYSRPAACTAACVVAVSRAAMASPHCAISAGLQRVVLVHRSHYGGSAAEADNAVTVVLLRLRARAAMLVSVLALRDVGTGGKLFECLGSSARSADSVRGCPRDRPSGCQRLRTYGGQRRHDECHSGTSTQVKTVCWDRQESTVKPSAQPTLVRTQHLPPPGKTDRSLRKRGPAGRFLLVAPCISVCHRGSRHSSGYGQIADSIRAERALRITAVDW